MQAIEPGCRPALRQLGRTPVATAFVQVAGVHDLAEALLLAECGVRCVGVPLRLAVHKPDLSEAGAARLVAALPAGMQSVCITYESDPVALVALCRELGVQGVQLHSSFDERDDTGAGVFAAVKALDPELFCIASLIVRSGEIALLERKIAACSPWVDAFITDTFDPQSGACGATGLVHDWETSHRLVQLSPRPVILAGGLGPDNVAAAIHCVRPAGVDAHTRLEGADGRKDPALVAAFLAEADRACGRLVHGD